MADYYTNFSLVVRLTPAQARYAFACYRIARDLESGDDTEPSAGELAALPEALRNAEFCEQIY